MTLLSRIHELAQKPLWELAAEQRDRGRRCAAVLCGFVPHEILHAAGCVPMRIRATGHSDTDMGSAYYSQTHCSLVRHVFDMALRGRMSGFDVALFSTGCDHSRRMYDAWRHANAAPQFRHLVAVSSDSTPAAVAALELELARLRLALEKAWGITIGVGAISQSIALYNRQRQLLLRLAGFRRDKACVLKGTDVLALHQVLSAIPVEEGNDILERLLAELSGMSTQVAGNGPRLFLVSSHFEDLRRMAVIEQTAGTVVGDLMCTGTGWFHGLVDEVPSDQPLHALAERCLRRLSCAHAADELERRAEFIIGSVAELECDAVVLDRLSFCAITAAEFFVLARRLKAKGIPVLELEGELHGGGEGQIRTRLEAFCEQLGNRSSMP